MPNRSKHFKIKFSHQCWRQDQWLSLSSALKQIFQFVPRPLQKVPKSESQELSARDKISEIIFSLDLDGNGSANAWELHDWMMWVEKRVHQHVVEDQVRKKT